MFAFMVLLFPIVLGFCCAHSTKRIYGFLIAIGAFTGIVVSGCTAVFSYMHRIPEYSFASNFFYFFLKEYFLPMVLVFAVYFFCTKDDYDFRVKAFFPVTGSFLSIYIPYCTIASYAAAFSFYLLFVKPVVVLSMVFLCSIIAYKIYRFALMNQKEKIVLYSFLALASIVFPSLIETLWLLEILLPVVYLSSVLYGLLALVLFFVETHKEDRIIY